MTTDDVKLLHGTRAWFQMVGTVMCEGAARARLSPDDDVSVVERYTDGVKMSDGLVQGLRFEIIDGKSSFRIGAQLNERADVTIEISADASRELNMLYSADLNYQKALSDYLSTGVMRMDGDPARLGDWMSAVHDPIVDRTR